MNDMVGNLRCGLAVCAGVVFAAYLAVAGQAMARSGNPLLTGPLPKCGPGGPAIQRLLDDLKQRRSWRGTHENTTGELELTQGRDGTWLLFYRSKDDAGRELVCLIARGHNSHELFGRPV